MLVELMVPSSRLGPLFLSAAAGWPLLVAPAFADFDLTSVFLTLASIPQDLMS